MCSCQEVSGVTGHWGAAGPVHQSGMEGHISWAMWLSLTSVGKELSSEWVIRAGVRKCRNSGLKWTMGWVAQRACPGLWDVSLPGEKLEAMLGMSLECKVGAEQGKLAGSSHCSQCTLFTSKAQVSLRSVEVGNGAGHRASWPECTAWSAKWFSSCLICVCALLMASFNLKLKFIFNQASLQII